MTDLEKKFFEGEESEKHLETSSHLGTSETPDTSTHTAEISLNKHVAQQTVIRRAALALIGALAGALATSAYFANRPPIILTNSSEKKCPPCPPENLPAEPEKGLTADATKTLEDAAEKAQDVSQASAISHPESATVTIPACPTPVDCPEPVACAAPIICPEPVECPPQKECPPEKVCAPIPAEKVCPPEKICPPQKECPPAEKCPPPKVVEKTVRMKVREVMERVVERKVPVIQRVVLDPALKRQLGSAYERIRKLEEQNGDLRMKLARERAHRPQKR